MALGAEVNTAKVRHVRTGGGTSPVQPGSYVEGANGVAFTETGAGRDGTKVWVPNASVAGVHEG
jgi:hypothetical protein